MWAYPVFMNVPTRQTQWELCNTKAWFLSCLPASSGGPSDVSCWGQIYKHTGLQPELTQRGAKGQVVPAFKGTQGTLPEKNWAHNKTNKFPRYIIIVIVLWFTFCVRFTYTSDSHSNNRVQSFRLNEIYKLIFILQCVSRFLILWPAPTC
jgi:hypothetical protein